MTELITDNQFESYALVRVDDFGCVWVGELLDPLPIPAAGSVAVAKPKRTLGGPPIWEKIQVPARFVRELQ